MKSISMIFSIVLTGDLLRTVTMDMGTGHTDCDTHLHESGLVWLEARLLVCCLVRDRDSVLNHGARSSSEDTERIVSSGSPATIGRGGTERPSCNIRVLYGRLYM